MSRNAALFSLGLVILFISSLMLPACSGRRSGTPVPSPTTSPVKTAQVSPAISPTPTPTPSPRAVDSYVVLAPSILNSGEREAVSVSLFHSGKPVAGTVNLSLASNGKQVFSHSSTVDGNGRIEFQMPQLNKGEYTLQVSGNSFTDQAKVSVQSGTMVFLQTDKPIYKPGQTIHIRAITLSSELRPVTSEVIIEVQDAKGTKVFRKSANTDEYGMASLDMPLSSEPNLGVWKIAAIMGERTTQLDVRVEEYVLPKYEVKLELPKDWFLVSEPIAGKVTSTYSFGKEVSGDLTIKAYRYVGRWEVYQTLTKSISGDTQFTLNPVGYVSGVPGAGGNGNVRLEATVVEKATGYEETNTQLLTVSASSLNVRVIPESSVFKPGLPLNLLIITRTPDNKPQDATVNIQVAYLNSSFSQVKQESQSVRTAGGKALLTLNPPAAAAGMALQANSGNAYTQVNLQAGYSPSGNFIHVEQVTEGTLKIGDDVKFRVNSTSEARNFYYEVLSRNKVVFTGLTSTPEIGFQLTPQMTPSARLLVYQILATSEVAADYLPFTVEAIYPQQLKAQFSKDEVRPGESLDIEITSQGVAKIGLGVVDRSVYILAENRLNLQQVFDELEKLYMKPQAELHEISVYQTIQTRGAKETFAQAGMVVMTNNNVPEGDQYKRDIFFGRDMVAEGAKGAVPPMAVPAPMPTPAATAAPSTAQPQGLAEVEKIRQFFPETWIWTDMLTGADGKGKLPVTAPDTITTWDLQAVALSKDHGLGMAEGSLRVFQPFFLTIDLPYSVTRSEVFPVKASIYNYLDTPQQVYVEIKPEPWFELLDSPAKTIDIAGNDIGSAQFTIKPTGLGIQPVTISARSKELADAVKKTVIVDPEGVQREAVQNYVLSPGKDISVDTLVPPEAVDGSARAYLAFTGSYLTQTIEGLDQLLQMPFGCGEQNMILFAPDVYITKYLKQSGQLKPEIMAKAEKLMITGYQRELTYRRSDGSFSAFGNQDQQGSLWLTAFVLKTFAQAKGTLYIDEKVLSDAAAWILARQKADGSFEQIGFVHHQEMMGGVNGKNALTAYVAVALIEAGQSIGAQKAIAYLEKQLDSIDDAYAMAIASYALELAASPARDTAHAKLMEMAVEDENGLHWPAPLGGGSPKPMPLAAPRMALAPESIRGHEAADIEATAYATLSLTKRSDKLSAGKGAKWLVSKRNSNGGFGSTQDTVVALQALTEYAQVSASDVNMTVTVTTGSGSRQLTINAQNYDVLQTIEIPVNGDVQVTVNGTGEAVAQSVVRFNLPEADDGAAQAIKIDVDYNTKEVEVNDLVTVSVSLTFNPPEPVTAEMIVLDISIPTGFAAVRESLDKVINSNPLIKRYDVAGRKAILYVEGLKAGASVNFDFQARALFPVRSQPAASTAYSYYNQSLRGETISGGIAVK